jgi:hypothetical protein
VRINIAGKPHLPGLSPAADANAAVAGDGAEPATFVAEGAVTGAPAERPPQAPR